MPLYSSTRSFKYSGPHQFPYSEVSFPSSSRLLYLAILSLWEMRVLSLSKIPAVVAPLSTSSSLPALPLLTKLSSRHWHLTSNQHSIHPTRQFTSAPLVRMSFSNTNVPADKPADPYKATNLTNPDLKEKVQDLVSFMESCKFGMMTTRIESTGLLTSRCMALAAKVGPPCSHTHNKCRLRKPEANSLLYYRKEAASTYFSTPTPSPAKPMTSSPNPRSTSPS